MELHLVNPDPRYSKVRLIEPAPLGYLHVAAEVRAPKRPGPVLFSRERSQLVGALQVLGRQLEQVPGVQKVTVYEAIALGLPSAYVRQRATLIQPARFDVVTVCAKVSSGLREARLQLVSDSAGGAVPALQRATGDCYQRLRTATRRSHRYSVQCTQRVRARCGGDRSP